MHVDLFATITPARMDIPRDEAPAPRSYPSEICAVCGKFGSFGFDRRKNHSPAERYSCLAHRHQVEKMK